MSQEPTTLTIVDEHDSSFIVAKLDPRPRMAEGFPALTVRKRNNMACIRPASIIAILSCWLVLIKCVSYWLDMSNLNAPCKGPKFLRKGSETARDTSCPFSMTLNFNTALLKPSLRSRSSSLFYCLNLPPRCLHFNSSWKLKHNSTSAYSQTSQSNLSSQDFLFLAVARCRDILRYALSDYSIFVQNCSQTHDRTSSSPVKSHRKHQ